MSAHNTARAELAARQRAALYPERHLIEGTVVALDDGRVVDIDNGQDGTQLLTVLGGLIGRQVRVTIVVAPEGGDR
jgi:hypothetical protein